MNKKESEGIREKLREKLDIRRRMVRGFFNFRLEQSDRDERDLKSRTGQDGQKQVVKKELI